LFIIDEILEKLGSLDGAEDGGEYTGVGGRGMGRHGRGIVGDSMELKRHENVGARKQASHLGGWLNCSIGMDAINNAAGRAIVARLVLLGLGFSVRFWW
jgi:hypothetical protein